MQFELKMRKTENNNQLTSKVIQKFPLETIEPSNLGKILYKSYIEDRVQNLIFSPKTRNQGGQASALSPSSSVMMSFYDPML